ncbi:hypothetical protein EPA93_37475 [Ktedonosporobacter rubrisoli]|uniref:SWIM-type domain-containing protein n=1 Tax=Ktedonosporobacter rubrisoli TaxID=2509675 RepID=A0A4P6K0M8_KTERU|nr:helicase-associated domain-containing protein [Ktedonosporobacter rubrisoli]QBD81363.1 hypothetical protein EPA93_37475 [Ktedonosporobacter rubrisoli]
MENVVPGTLQRLRAADIIRMAGLTAASLGQEYCRLGAVHDTQRQGGRISGIVDVAHTISTQVTHLADDPEPGEEGGLRRYPVEVEIQSATTWQCSCPCSSTTSIPCAHAAALLYQWLARPATFVNPMETVKVAPAEIARSTTSSAPATHEPMRKEATPASKPTRPFSAARATVNIRGPLPLTGIDDILTQMGLSDLRAIAREYELVPNGMNKQQLIDAILEKLKQPEAVRHVAATLEKPQRQLLAALTLAGGALTDDDLRGLFERFSLGQPAQFQNVLTALQHKGLLFRTSLNSSAQQRIGLSGALLDVGWYVPGEVRTALRVTVPVASYDVQQSGVAEADAPIILQREPYQLLTDLLLVARALDSYRLVYDDEWREHNAPFQSTRTLGSLPSEGLTQIPPPADMPTNSLLTALQAAVPRSAAFLRFAVRLLHQADILHKDDGGTPYLRALPNVAQLLLGPARAEIAHDLFELWLTQSSYEDLFALQEESVRLRCRATAHNHPLIRPGELDAENSEARQALLALLAQAPSKQWMSFSSFARFVYRLNPLFLQKRQKLFTSPHWWVESEDGRVLRPNVLGDWQRAEMRYLTRLLTGPLHWWGICDIACTPDGRLLAFSLTPTADKLLHEGKASEPLATQDAHNLAEMLDIVDEDKILITSSVQSWSLIELMETFTEAAGVYEGRLRYRLTPKALSAAMSRGQHPEHLLEALRHVASHRSHQDDPLARLEAQLGRWTANYGRVRIYTGVTLLETADPTVMRELAATTALNNNIVQSIQPSLLILNKPGAKQITDELKRHGQPPLIHDRDSYAAE